MAYRPFTADKCRDREETVVKKHSNVDRSVKYVCRNVDSGICGNECDISNGFPDGCPYRDDTASFTFRYRHKYGEPAGYN